MLALLAFGSAVGCRGSSDAQERLGIALAQLTREVTANVPARPIPRGEPSVAPAFGPAFDGKSAERKALIATNEAAAKCAVDMAKDVAGSVEDCTTRLAKERPALDALLALHACERPGAPSGATPLGLFVPGAKETDVHRAIGAVCSHGAAAIQIELARNDPSRAARVCVETLEVARDYVLGASLVSAMVFDACVKKVEAPCKRALAGTQDPVASSRRADVAAVVASLPSFAWFADADTAAVNLAICGWTIPSAERAKLPPDARAIVTHADAERANLGFLDKGRQWKLCESSFESMFLRARSFHAPKGSDERKALTAQSEQAAKGGLEPADPQRYADTWDANIDLLRALAGSR